MLSLLPIATKYGAAAVFGAATKTYFEYKRDKAPLTKVLGLFIINSILAVLLSSIVVSAFISEVPEKGHFAYLVAYLSGAIGINIISGLSAINWEKVIQSRVNK